MGPECSGDMAIITAMEVKREKATRLCVGFGCAGCLGYVGLIGQQSANAYTDDGPSALYSAPSPDQSDKCMY